MRVRSTLIFLAVIGLFSCKKDNQPNKVIEGIHPDTTQRIIPANAAQQMLLVNIDAIKEALRTISESEFVGAEFPELTGPDNQSRYTFSLSERRFGKATATLQFFDGSSAVIDPISNITSTGTLKTVTISIAGSSTLFAAFTSSVSLTLDSAGNPQSTKRLTGSSAFNGSGYTVTYAFSGAGVPVTFGGFTSGGVTGSGTGPNSQTTTVSLRFSSDLESDGTIIWEGKSGALHFNNNGSGFVVTSLFRVLLD